MAPKYSDPYSYHNEKKKTSQGGRENPTNVRENPTNVRENPTNVRENLWTRTLRID